ncbi:MAG TPA: hypothetical protein VNM16_01035 [Bacillota bacterium]|nr:hypothetical protein [Bacillota bacterium]
MKGFWPGVAVGSLCAATLVLYFGMSQPRSSGLDAMRRRVEQKARGRLRVVGRAVQF